MTKHQIEQQYLLLIAMLNFDFRVTLVFNKNAFSQWQINTTTTQHLHALQLYGVETFFTLNATVTKETEFSVMAIDDNEFTLLKAKAEVIS